MRFHIWGNGGNSEGPHNWRYESQFEQALVPQDKKMNDKHLAQLKAEWKEKHPFKLDPSLKGTVLAATRKIEYEQAAEDWAKKNEPKRFLNPLLRPINGIKADTDLRRNGSGDTAILSSSWVGNAKLPVGNAVNPSTVTFDLGGKDYTFKINEIGGYPGLKAALSAPSIGSYIAKNWIGHLPSSRKNWKTNKKGESVMPRWLSRMPAHKKSSI